MASEQVTTEMKGQMEILSLHAFGVLNEKSAPAGLRPERAGL